MMHHEDPPSKEQSFQIRLDGKIYSGAYILELVNDHDRSTVKFIKR